MAMRSMNMAKKAVRRIRSWFGILLFLQCVRCHAHEARCLQDLNCRKIAFYKTHKTGSTTLGGVLFRLAAAQNMTIYQSSKHYLTPGINESVHLHGHTDMVLQHISQHERPDKDHLAVIRAFYSRALGTSNYAFLTVLRNPLERYVSDFFFFTEPTLRHRNISSTLESYVSNRTGGNRMASELSVYSMQDALQFLASEEFMDGLYIPIEYLDYGLALLAVHCGWTLRQVMYLPVNKNIPGLKRFGNAVLQGRPSIASLAADNPQLLHQIAGLNELDAILYGGTVTRLLDLLAPSKPAAARVMALATRLTAVRTQLQAKCYTTTVDMHIPSPHATDANSTATPLSLRPPAPIPGPSHLGDSSLAAMCLWYTVLDLIYENLTDPQTGRVGPRTQVYSFYDNATSWALKDILEAVDEHLTPYENTSVLYYHGLLAVNVNLPQFTAADEYENGTHAPSLLYRKLSQRTVKGNGKSATASGAPRLDRDEALAVAVYMWALHHAQEGLQHLVFLVSGLSTRERDIVRQAATAATAKACKACAEPFTTFELMSCDGPRAASPPQSHRKKEHLVCSRAGLVALGDRMSRSRWSATLPSLTTFLYGKRGSVRSTLLSYEVDMPKAGAVCAPLVPWRAAQPQTAALRTKSGRKLQADADTGELETAEGPQATILTDACLASPCSRDVEEDADVNCVMLRAMPLLGHKLTYLSNGEVLPKGRDTITVSLRKPHQHRLEVVQLKPSMEKNEVLIRRLTLEDAGRCTKFPKPRLHLPTCDEM